jgi:1-acyl-sn-glycerol-3-phosphate acyltransferase
MFYELLRVFFTVYFRIFHSFQITSKEHIPNDEPVILCANHSSYFDSMLVGLCTRRRVHFLIYEAFYRNWFLGPFIRALRAIPVTERKINKEALKKALNVLNCGGVIGIFPEGRLTRTGMMGQAELGMALLAALSNAAIVPITIIDAFSVYPKGKILPRPTGKIVVQVHPPVTVDPTRRHEKGYLQSVTDEVMGRIEKSLLHKLQGRKF